MNNSANFASKNKQQTVRTCKRLVDVFGSNLFEKVSSQLLIQLGGGCDKVKQVNGKLGPLHHKDETVSSFKEVKYLDNSRHLAWLGLKRGEGKKNVAGNLLESEHEDKLQWNFSFAQFSPGNHLARVNLFKQLLFTIRDTFVKGNKKRGNSHLILRKSTLVEPVLLPLASGQKAYFQQTPGL